VHVKVGTRPRTCLPSTSWNRQTAGNGVAAKIRTETIPKIGSNVRFGLPTEKHSERADVFRSSPKNGRWFSRPKQTSRGSNVMENSTNDRFAPKAALGRLEIQLPLYPRKQTRLGNRGMSEKCQHRTFSLTTIVASQPGITSLGFGEETLIDYLR
jgi:hypothetical protein